MNICINKKILVNLAIHFILWSLFIFLEDMEPYEREIRPEELWKYKYPKVDSYVSSCNLFTIVLLGPLLVVFLVDAKDLPLAIENVSLSCSLCGILTSLLKITVGRPRPNFYFSCIPSSSYTKFVRCTGSAKFLKNGRKSFPSGHASFIFTSMGFISLYLSSKLQIFGKYKGHTWRIVITILPLIFASLVAISRMCDYHHHPEDVIGGVILGKSLSYFIYHQIFNKPPLPSSTQSN